MSRLQVAFLTPPLPHLRHHPHPYRRHIARSSPPPNLYPPLRPKPHMSTSPTPNPSDLSPIPPSTPPTTTTGFSLSDLPHFPFQNLSPNLPLFQHPGAYCIRDDTSKILYMGYSKNIASKLTLHQQLVPSLCHSFQVYIPTATQEAPLTAEVLESVLEFWVRENGGVPEGNTAAREQWEGGREQRKNPETSRQPSSTSNPQSTNQQSTSTTPPPNPSPSVSPSTEIPIRERTTSRRRSTRRHRANDQADPFADNFRSATGATPRRRRKEKTSNGWGGGMGLGGGPDEEYVDVDVDPLDPFSASKKQRGGSGAWDFQFDEEEGEEDWMPIVALMGCAGLIWLFGLLSNAIPAATPSLGM